MSNLRLMPDSFEKLSAGRDIGFTITGKDIEDDTVDVRLDFGDSTASFSDTIWDTEVGFETATDHAFDTDSDYTLVLTASDGHNTTVMTLVLAITEEEGGTPWMLILGIVAVAAVVVVVAVFLIRRKGAGGREEEEIRLP